MPLIYWVDADRRIVRSVGMDALTVDDLKGYFAATRADPMVNASMHRLMDLRKTTSLPSSDEIRELAALSRALAPAPEARMAILASSDLAFGVSMMFKGFVGFGDQLIVLRDEAEAVEWLEARAP